MSRRYYGERHQLAPSITTDEAVKEKKRLEELFNDANCMQEYNPSMAQLSRDPILNALCQLGCLRLNTDRAFVSLIDDKNQYLIAETTQSISLHDNKHHKEGDGLCLGARPLDLFAGVCAGTMPVFTATGTEGYQSTPNIFADHTRYVINDFSAEEKYKDRPYVTEFPYMRYYAEVPLYSRSGYVMGTYAVIDNKPRKGLDEDGFLTLSEIASSIMKHLEMVKMEQDHAQASRLLQGLDTFVQEGRRGKSVKKNKDRRRSRKKSTTDTPRRTSPLRSEHVVEPTALPNEHGPNSRSSSIIRGSVSYTTKSETTSPIGDHNFQSMGSTEQEKWSMPKGVEESQNDTNDKSSPDESSSIDEVRSSFMRAAHLLREAMDLDGVVFLDASPCTFASRYNTEYTDATPMSALMDSFDSFTFRTDETYQDSQPSSRPALTTRRSAYDTNVYKSTPVQSYKTPERLCEVLGISLNLPKPDSLNDLTYESYTIPEDLHQSLIQNYPDGRVFNFAHDSQGSNTYASTSPDEGGQSRSGSLTSDVSLPHLTNETLLEVGVQSYFEEAYTMVFMPLWNPHKDTWLAGTLGWSKNDKRVLQPEDFSYFTAFGNSIMAEISRLELLSTDRAKSDFISSISHELRSPLHGILGSAELLKESSTPDQRHLIDMVENSGRMLLDTMEHIFDYSKINTPETVNKPYRRDSGIIAISNVSNNISGVTSDFDLGIMIEDCVENLIAGHQHSTISHTTSQQGLNKYMLVQDNGSVTSEDPKLPVTVILRIDQAQPWCLASKPAAWQRCILNILGNALKYTKTGFIEITMRAEHSKKVSENGDVRGLVFLTVRDTGCGIGKTYLQTHLFTPFKQENPLVSGTGLGLSIVKKLIEGLDGSLQIRSEEGVGTDVYLSMPTVFTMSPTVLERPFPRRYENIIVNFMGFDEHDEYSSGASMASSSSSLESALHASLFTHAKKWLGLDLKSVSATNFQEADIVLLPETKLAQYDEEMQKPTRASFIIVCTEHTVHERAKHIKSGRIRYLSPPYGPRQMAVVLDSLILDSSPLIAEIDKSQIEPVKLETIIEVSVTELAAPGVTESQPVTILTEPSSSKQRPLVMLVDDNEVNIKILARCMQKLDVDYQTAVNGLEAFEAFKDAVVPFDCIFMDINMPIMDGFAATQAIRTFENEFHRPSTHIVAMTGLGSADSQQEAYRSGMDLFMTKPVQMKKIRSVIEEFIRGTPRNMN